MAGGDGSSEEFVEDDSGGDEEEEEEEEEDGDSSASFESEEDDENDDDDDDEDGGTGDDSDVFETPVKARKRPRTPSSQQQQQRLPTSAGKSKRKMPPVATADGDSGGKKKKGAARAAAAAAAAAGGGAGAGKSNTTADATAAAAAGGKGKGKGKEKAAAAAGSSSIEASAPQTSSSSPSPGEAVERTTQGGGAVGEGRAGRERSSIAAPSESSRKLQPARSNPAGGGAGTGGRATTSAMTTAGKTAGAAAGSGGVAKTPKAAVSDYMQQSNRPYSCINVFDNLRKKIPKAMVQKLLDELVRDGTLKMQEFSKAKIYYANQDALPNGAGDASADKLQRLDQEAKTLTAQLENVSKQEQQTKSRVMSLSSQPTDAALAEKLETSARELEQAEARNASAKGQGRSVVPGGMKAAKSDFNKFRALWVNRKRNAMDVVDMIADGMEKKPKAVMEMLGVEVDEEPIPAKM